MRCLFFYILIFSKICCRSQDLDFNKDILPIIKMNCTPCHNKNAGLPFKLENYKDIASRIKTIEYVINKRIMPPWKADKEYTHFNNEKFLSQEEICKINTWIKNGNLSKGNNKIKISDSNFTAYGIEKPDLVIDSKINIKILPSIRDTFVYIEFPYKINTAHYISDYEIVMTNKTNIHHVLFDIFSDSTLNFFKSSSIKFENVKNSGNTFNIMILDYSKLAFGGGWVPGQYPFTLPVGVAYYLPSRGKILIYLHFAPTNKELNTRFKIKLRYTKDIVERTAMGYRVGSEGEDPPFPPMYFPEESIKKYTCESILNKDMSIFSIGPHMHYIGKTFLAYAIKPNKDTIPLIKINDWDFNWQQYYTPKKFIYLTKGTIIHIEGVFDNTSTNDKNLYSPPKLITEGSHTYNEMLQFNLFYVPYKPGDENVILK